MVAFEESKQNEKERNKEMRKDKSTNITSTYRINGNCIILEIGELDGKGHMLLYICG